MILRFLMGFFLLSMVHASAEVTWEVLNEGKAFRNDLNQVEWAESGFVAVGENAILTSVDGLEWEVVNLEALVDDVYEEIAVAPGSLVIGRGTAVYSSDLSVWQQSSLPAGVSFLSAAGDGAQFLALGDDGSLYQSTDGLSWSVYGDAPGSAKGLAFGNGRWVSFDEIYFYHSLDGQTWTAVEQAVAVNAPGESRYVPEVSEVDFSGGMFVANRVLDDELSWNTYAVSSDGATWNLAEAPLYARYIFSDSVWVTLFSPGLTLPGEESRGPSLEIDDVHLDSSGNVVLVHSRNQAVNRFGSYSNSTYKDIDYFRYEDSASSPSGRVVVVGRLGLAMTSDDPFGEFPVWRDVGPKDTGIIDAASNGTSVIGIWRPYDRFSAFRHLDPIVLKTEDGKAWEPLLSPDGGNLKGHDVSYVNDRWFLRDFTDEELFTSNDGIVWTQESTVFSGRPMPMAQEGLYGAGVYLSVSEWSGFSGGQGVSSDGIVWDELPEDVDGAGAFGNGEFKVLQSDLVFSSVNGRDWTSESVEGLKDSPPNLRFFKGRWLAGNDSLFFHESFSVISNDCVNWSPIGLDFSADWGEFLLPIDVSNLHELNGYLITHSWWDKVGISSDGVRWEVVEFPEEAFIEVDLTTIAWTLTLPLGDRILGLGPNQMAFISSPIAMAPETTDLRVLTPGFLEMAGAAGKEYQLMESSSLMGDDWNPVGDWLPAATDGQVLFWPVDADAGRMFYQVEER